MSKLFRLSDITLLLAPTLIIGLVVAAMVWNLVSPEGEPLPLISWVIAGVNIVATLAIVVVFYVQRWLWVRQYAYSVMGVHYFYEEGAKKYLRVSIESDIRNMLKKWVSYYQAKGTQEVSFVARRSQIEAGQYIRGIVCIFRRESHWIHTAPGWWTRRVTGLAFENTVIVGQGDRMVEKTAHAHELSHIHISRCEGRRILEDESHEIFKEVGV